MGRFNLHPEVALLLLFNLHSSINLEHQREPVVLILRDQFDVTLVDQLEVVQQGQLLDRPEIFGPQDPNRLGNGLLHGSRGNLKRFKFRNIEEM